MEPLISNPPEDAINPFLETKTNEPFLIRIFKVCFCFCSRRTNMTVIRWGHSGSFQICCFVNADRDDGYFIQGESIDLLTCIERSSSDR
jgi:hypothetical protein